MNNQKSNFSFNTLWALLSLIGCLLGQTDVQAQSATFNYEGKYHDYTIPLTDKEYLVLTAVGGDGGVAYKKGIGYKKGVIAGGGAYLQAYFKIGNEANDLKPGSILRMIVGGKGTDIEGLDHTPFSAGSGGGTGIAYKEKNTNKWVLLMVAGGGAGSGSDLMYGDQYGTAGQAYIAGEEGNGKGGDSHGSNPNKAGGRAGAYGSDLDWENNRYGKHAKPGWPGGPDKGEPTGGACVGGDPKGGWGFGAGGNGDPIQGYSSGGGGYTGGDGGDVESSSGKGGTSYLNESFATFFISTDGATTTNTNPGYIKVAAANDLPVDPAIKLAASTQKCIAVESDELHAGNNMYIWDCTTYARTQSWKFDGLKIKYSPSQDLCLAVNSDKLSNGQSVQLRGCTNNVAQQWVYDGSTQQIRSAVDTEKCLEVATSGVFEKGKGIRIWDCNGYDRQKFIVE